MAFETIAFDATSTRATVTSTSATWNHTCTGENLVLLVYVYIGSGSDLITGITYNGVAMTRHNTRQQGEVRGYIYKLTAPATGTNAIIVSASSSVQMEVVAASYTGVSEDGMTYSISSAGTGTSSSIAPVTSIANAWTVAGVKAGGGSLAAAGDTTNRSGNPAIFDEGPIETPGANTMNATHNDGTYIWCGGVISPAEIVSGSSFYYNFL